MSSPFVTIMPPSESHVVYLCVLFILFIPLFFGTRFIVLKEGVKLMKSFFPNYIIMQGANLTVLMGGFFIFVGFSLVPLSVIGFHLPLLGIGVSFAVWFCIFFMGEGKRPFQFKKEYLGDSSLSWVWVIISAGLETISRGARAVTLGARISVNVMMGGILHSVIGGSDSSWGLFILCCFEVLVVVIQTYVFSLLILLYSVELE